ncbi:hypothetical protein [Thermus scotoductus]|uniref:Uncharacterized protein n=1 Tax=Thermus scotoductus TaxID=37636 RepID=A0A430RF45_THESC|nr:hypothetical protein [Thermus scotoductus]RTG97755.1 hypothetical protein CSW49_02350 [Thermus scotoductus]RTH06277.1 hypothetical protein CSW45_01975 [Thermus scotoductus]RTH19190.1 hypothetical protein CSW42_07815 [Thermus scotoductus]RTH99871.1 hypothetical protein CSW28_06795 [Thermus scotoductus]RTI21055.1 hypothetical protein CSW21_07825 [Thermus scotoductus]
MNRLVHYLLGFPFPTPAVLFQFALGAALGLLLGLLYHRIWPLPPRWGRMVRLFVLLPPALVLGVGLVVLFQAQVALPYIVPLIAWLTPDYGPKDYPTPKGPA